MISTYGGINLIIDPKTMDFHYGNGVHGPRAEFRSLDAIRTSLMYSSCNGPSPVYSIAMDVYEEEDESDLRNRNLLFGIVAYAAGQLGQEPVRSQGHVHTVAPHSGWSPPELFEIWEGAAIIYGQEFTSDDPGRCVAVAAGPGDKIVIPPGWAHAVINADPSQRMVFGAWCDRQYGFDYTGVRAHGGLAYFPLLLQDGTIEWIPNTRYKFQPIMLHRSRSYPELGLNSGEPIYRQYQRSPASVDWVAEPQRFSELWRSFLP